MDGEWAVQKNDLTFLNFRGKSAIMTNNLVIKSPKIEFCFDFSVMHNPAKAANISSVVSKDEVIAFTVAPETYDIKHFDQESTIGDMKGIGIFFFRPQGDNGVIYIKQFENEGPANLQMIFSENYAFDNRMYCQHNYLNATTSLNITMDFVTATITVIVNNKPCVQYRIPTQKFPVNKATVSMMAYSSKSAPISIKLNEAAIRKQATVFNEADSFHTNVNSLVNTLHRYDPFHVQNASLTNVMLIEVH